MGNYSDDEESDNEAKPDLAKLAKIAARASAGKSLNPRKTQAKESDSDSESSRSSCSVPDAADKADEDMTVSSASGGGGASLTAAALSEHNKVTSAEGRKSGEERAPLHPR